MTSRHVLNFYAFLCDLGAFAVVLYIAFSVLNALIKFSDLEGYLINQLFKQPPNVYLVLTKASENMSAHSKLVKLAHQSFINRVKITPSNQNCCVRGLKWVRCICRKVKRDRSHYSELKAR